MLFGNFSSNLQQLFNAGSRFWQNFSPQGPPFGHMPQGGMFGGLGGNPAAGFAFIPPSGQSNSEEDELSDVQLPPELCLQFGMMVCWKLVRDGPVLGPQDIKKKLDDLKRAYLRGEVEELGLHLDRSGIKPPRRTRQQMIDEMGPICWQMRTQLQQVLYLSVFVSFVVLWLSEWYYNYVMGAVVTLVCLVSAPLGKLYKKELSRRRLDIFLPLRKTEYRKYLLMSLWKVLLIVLFCFGMNSVIPLLSVILYFEPASRLLTLVMFSKQKDLHSSSLKLWVFYLLTAGVLMCFSLLSSVAFLVYAPVWTIAFCATITRSGFVGTDFEPYDFAAYWSFNVALLMVGIAKLLWSGLVFILSRIRTVLQVSYGLSEA